jgi:hypothetical protein
MTFEQVQAKVAAMIAKPPLIIIVEDESDYSVVWSGGELLPDRESVADDRLRYVPSYDLDDGEAVRSTAKRLYNMTGNHTKEKREASRQTENQ